MKKYWLFKIIGFKSLSGVFLKDLKGVSKFEGVKHPFTTILERLWINQAILEILSNDVMQHKWAASSKYTRMSGHFYYTKTCHDMKIRMYKESQPEKCKLLRRVKWVFKSLRRVTTPFPPRLWINQAIFEILSNTDIL